jgi:hypothetical protein
MENALKSVFRRVLNHPNGTVCKHWMLAVLLSEMETIGAEHTLEFVRAVVNAEDEIALELLDSENITPKYVMEKA